MLDLLYNRRSTRSFLDRPVEPGTVEKLVEGILLSPSGRGIRPWEFVLVDNKGLITELSRSKEHGSRFVAGAPLVIVILGKPELTDVWIEDTSVAAVVCHLLAESLGLGSCWVQIRNRKTADGTSSSDFIRRLLGIPTEYEVEVMIALGYPDKKGPAYTKESLLYEKVHKNAFGESYLQVE